MKRILVASLVLCFMCIGCKAEIEKPQIEEAANNVSTEFDVVGEILEK